MTQYNIIEWLEYKRAIYSECPSGLASFHNINNIKFPKVFGFCTNNRGSFSMRAVRFGPEMTYSYLFQNEIGLKIGKLDILIKVEVNIGTYI